MNNNDFDNPIVVASIVGSLPMGGTKKQSAIYALQNTPKSLMFHSKDTNPLKKNNIKLDGILAFSIDDVLTSSEADTLVALTETLGYRKDAPGIATPSGMRMNKTVHWVSDQYLLDIIFQRIAKHLPAYIDGKALAPFLSHRINFYKYENGDIFNKHIDGGWPGYGLNDNKTSMIQWEGYFSKLTMLIYLNGKEEGVNGGKTILYSPQNNSTEITPKKGKALFFRHGSNTDSVLHVGSKVKGTVAKYVARINILYKNN